MERERASAPEEVPAGQVGSPGEPLHPPAGEAPAGCPTPEDLAAVAEEGRTVEAAAELPAAGAPSLRGRGPDRSFVFGALGLALLLAFGWLGGTAVWQLRRDLRALEGRLAGAQERASRVESHQARAALLRVRADLEALRQTLPADLAGEVTRADAILGEVADRVSSSP